MKTTHKIQLALLALGLAGAALYTMWVNDAPRRASLESLARLDAVLHSANRAQLLDLVAIPAAIRGRSVAEETEFLVKALTDEISPEGLAVLRKEAKYGPLKEIFPDKAEAWTRQAGVKVEDCVAFKLDANGLSAQVVLVKPSSPVWPYRIVRLNNVKQLAELNPSSMEKKQ